VCSQGKRAACSITALVSVSPLVGRARRAVLPSPRGHARYRRDASLRRSAELMIVLGATARTRNSYPYLLVGRQARRPGGARRGRRRGGRLSHRHRVARHRRHGDSAHRTRQGAWAARDACLETTKNQKIFGNPGKTRAARLARRGNRNPRLHPPADLRSYDRVASKLIRR